ncbi:LysR family transcriptional regulator [Alteromonas pelagimontana]|uniref:LysR family transcriptional regulator n=1 Tax=Alteromonas pelagimontana TaxID=1858656 RepID=A0A6M4MI28_9ALTE|nr:LysR family transcriptional regulator [Alteromonas pelagimontana]QJR82578.1 LysR family transcriptional regulator [Alteromonas pelagimontana]
MAVSYRNMLAFIRVAESATFAEAAEKLHLTQPALSSSIKKMEEQLGGKLFSRSTRHVQLTPEGETLLPTAQRLLNEWDETFHDMQNLFAMQTGKLTVAAMPSFAESKLPVFLKAYHDAYPNVRLRILDVVMEATIDSVLTGRAEIGFTFEPEVLDGFEFVPLFSDHFVAVLYPSHPQASAKSIGWPALLANPFIAMNRGSAVRKWTEQIAQDVGTLTIIAEAGQLGSLGQLIAQRLGVSVVPALCTAQMQSKGLICLPIENSPLIKRVGMIRQSRGSLSAAAQALWEMCPVLS